MKKIRVIRKDSGLKSGSREVSLIEALSIRFNIPVEEEFISCKKVKNYQRGPAAMMRGSNMGILPYWPNILLITWGLLLHKAGSLSFSSCEVTRSGSV